MVLFFSSAAHNPPVVIYMGKDKHENEDLRKFAWPQDVWFHANKLSSAHVYLRMPDGMTWDRIPEPLLVDCAQLVKANSIEGNKKDEITIVYTPADNLKRSRELEIGQVSFHSTKKVKKVYVRKRENAIINRLSKTKVERQVDHEQERRERVKRKDAVKAAAAAAQKKAEAELAEQRKAEAELAKRRKEEEAAIFYEMVSRGMDEEDLPQKSVEEMEDDFM